MESFEQIAEMMPSYLLSGIPGAMGYAYYYMMNTGRVPEIFAGEGPFIQLLQETCPILKEEYRPPPLVHESRLMTIVAALGRHRGLSYPYMREVFETSDGAEIALDWWDARLKPESPAEVPVVPSSLLDSLSYYYNSLPQLRLPQLQIHMRMPQIQIPYFGPLRRSASAAGIELAHLEGSTLSDDDSEVDSGAYSPRGERAASERAYSERAPSPELDLSDITTDVPDLDEESSLRIHPSYTLEGIPEGDVEFGLEDLKGSLENSPETGENNAIGNEQPPVGMSLFDSLSYYYTNFLPHLRMPYLQIPKVLTSLKSFSTLQEVQLAVGARAVPAADETQPSISADVPLSYTPEGLLDRVREGSTSTTDGTTSNKLADNPKILPATLPVQTVPAPNGLVLILPGMTGDSTRNYVQGLVQVVEQLGFTAVVMNYRGATGNLRACFMADTTDVAQVIRHLKQRYPIVPIVAIGVSLGGILLTNYVTRCGMANEDTLLLAVMTVSVAWNFFESAKVLEEPLNWLLFNRMLTRALCDAVQKHEEILGKTYDLSGLENVRTLRQFDESLTSKMFGYASADEYYRSATLHDKVAHIKTPLLAINAADDVFSPYAAIPRDEAKLNPLLCILVTSHGGHIGFLEGKNPFGTNYVERVAQQFVKAVFDNQEKVAAMSRWNADELPGPSNVDIERPTPSMDVSPSDDVNFLDALSHVTTLDREPDIKLDSLISSALVDG